MPHPPSLLPSGSQALAFEPSCWNCRICLPCLGNSPTSALVEKADFCSAEGGWPVVQFTWPNPPKAARRYFPRHSALGLLFLAVSFNLQPVRTLLEGGGSSLPFFFFSLPLLCCPAMTFALTRTYSLPVWMFMYQIPASLPLFSSSLSRNS